MSDVGSRGANHNGWGSAYTFGARDGKLLWSFVWCCLAQPSFPVAAHWKDVTQITVREKQQC